MALWRYASLIKEKLFSSHEDRRVNQPKSGDWDECVQEASNDEQNIRVSKISSDLGSRPLRINAGPDEHLDWLMQTIETNVIPRLLVAHSTAISPNRAPIMGVRLNDQSRVDELTHLVLQDDATKAADFVQALYEQGVPLDEIYLRLLAPVARHLGVMWEEDRATFTQVTTAMWRIKQLIYDFSPLFQEFARTDEKAPHAMLVPLPGSQHTLGLFMVSEFFRRGGWKVWGELAATEGEIIAAIKTQHFDLVGLSVSTEDQLPALKRFIELLKEESQNPRIGIMVGGPILIARPELKQGINADIVGLDAEEALAQAEFFLEKSTR
jgi:MerR family transcriptional regulator, light-induced transcriptional regulator